MAVFLSLFLFSQFAEDLFALLPELRAEAAVDEDVGGRVDGEEEVADADHDARPQREALEPVCLAFHGVPERERGGKVFVQICRGLFHKKSLNYKPQIGLY